VVGGELATTEGTLAGGQTRAVQRVDPGSGRASVVGALPWGLGHAAAFCLRSHLYVAGGRRGAVATAAILGIDLRTGAVRRAGRLPRALSDAAVVLDRGSAWVIGGEATGPGTPLDTVYELAVRE
jgi:N-acetylneuraminic acid mutarotase